jgi:tetratricopeptide (TPR) repeat protein
MCLILFIIVLVQLFKKEGALKGILGFFCGIYTFIWGWMKHKELALTKVMALWSIMTVASIVLPSIMATSGAYELLSYMNTLKGDADLKMTKPGSATKSPKFHLANESGKIKTAAKTDGIKPARKAANLNGDRGQMAMALWQGAEYKDPKKAIDYWDQAIEIMPNSAKAYNNRGLAYYDLKLYQQAIKDYNQAISLDADYVAAHNNRGNSYYELAEFELALADFNQSLRLDSNYSKAHFNRALVYYQMDKNDQACSDFQKACDLGDCDGLKWAMKNSICK